MKAADNIKRPFDDEIGYTLLVDRVYYATPIQTVSTRN